MPPLQQAGIIELNTYMSSSLGRHAAAEAALTFLITCERSSPVGLRRYTVHLWLWYSLACGVREHMACKRLQHNPGNIGVQRLADFEDGNGVLGRQHSWALPCTTARCLRGAAHMQVGVEELRA